MSAEEADGGIVEKCWNPGGFLWLQHGKTIPQSKNRDFCQPPLHKGALRNWQIVLTRSTRPRRTEGYARGCVFVFRKAGGGRHLPLYCGQDCGIIRQILAGFGGKFYGMDLAEEIFACPSSFGGYGKVDTGTFFG